MSIGSLAEALQRASLFQGLRPTQLTEIARLAERVRFKDGDSIITEGQTGEASFLIVSGTAKRTAGPGSREDTFGPGTLLGEMAMLVETDYSSTITCEEPVRALRISRERLLEQMTSDPSLADHFVTQLSGRLRELAAELRKVDETLETAERSRQHAFRPALLTFEPPPHQTAPH